MSQYASILNFSAAESNCTHTTTHIQSRCLSAFTQCCTAILKIYRKKNENVGGQAIKERESSSMRDGQG